MPDRWTKQGSSYEEALDLRRSHLKPTDADIALNLSELGKLCLAQGDSAAARDYLDEALSIYLPALDEITRLCWAAKGLAQVESM